MFVVMAARRCQLPIERHAKEAVAKEAVAPRV